MSSIPNSLRMCGVSGKIISIANFKKEGFEDYFDFDNKHPHTLEAEVLLIIEDKKDRPNKDLIKFVCSKKDIFFGPGDGYGHQYPDHCNR